MDTSCVTPLSYLHVLCRKKGFLPQYELRGQEGRTHEPLFTFNCSVADLITTGEGTSKKKSKHNAALNMLIAISNLMDSAHVLADLKEHVTDLDKKFSHESSQQTILNKDNNENINLGPDGDQKLDEPIESIGKSNYNPVGGLLEICLSNRIPPPIYSLVNAHGMAHERVFVFEACVVNHKCTGEAKSKKMAKRLAAHELLIKIRANIEEFKMYSAPLSPIKPITNEEILAEKEKKEHHDKKSNLDAKENALNDFTPLSQYLELIEPKFALAELKNMDLNSVNLSLENAKSYLEKIAEEQGFTVEYRQHTNKNNSEFTVMVYVDLHLHPPICVAGLGQTTQTALEFSVKNGLKMLQTVTRSITSLQQKRASIQNYIHSSEIYKKYYSTDAFGPDLKKISIEDILDKKIVNALSA